MVEQDLSEVPTLTYQQKSSQYLYAEHKSTHVSRLNPCSPVQINI